MSEEKIEALMQSVRLLARWIEERHPDLLVACTMADPYTWRIHRKADYVEVEVVFGETVGTKQGREVARFRLPSFEAMEPEGVLPKRPPPPGEEGPEAPSRDR